MSDPPHLQRGEPISFPVCFDWSRHLPRVVGMMGFQMWLRSQSIMTRWF